MVVYINQGYRQYDKAPVGIRRRGVWEFQAVLSGKIRPVFPDIQVDSASRMLWVFGPDNLHGWRGSGATDTTAEVAVFHFDLVPREISRLCGSAGCLSVPLSEPDAGILRNEAGIAHKQYFHPLKISQLYFRRLLLNLSYLILSGSGRMLAAEDQNRSKTVLERACALFETEMEFGIGVEEIARRCDVSPGHMRRIFQQLEGQSPVRIFNRMRADRGADLLSRTDLPVTEIGLLCGY